MYVRFFYSQQREGTEFHMGPLPEHEDDYVWSRVVVPDEDLEDVRQIYERLLAHSTKVKIQPTTFPLAPWDYAVKLGEIFFPLEWWECHYDLGIECFHELRDSIQERNETPYLLGGGPLDNTIVCILDEDLRWTDGESVYQKQPYIRGKSDCPRARYIRPLYGYTRE